MARDSIRAVSESRGEVPTVLLAVVAASAVSCRTLDNDDEDIEVLGGVAEPVQE